MKVTEEMADAWVSWTGGPNRKLSPTEIGCLREGFYGGFLAAQAIDAQRATTAKTGVVEDESAVRDSECAPNDDPKTNPGG